jgi:hypothetical protein
MAPLLAIGWPTVRSLAQPRGKRTESAEDESERGMPPVIADARDRPKEKCCRIGRSPTSAERVAQPGQELASASPIRPHAVEFFAHEPAGQVGSSVPGLGEQ